MREVIGSSWDRIHSTQVNVDGCVETRDDSVKELLFKTERGLRWEGIQDGLWLGMPEEAVFLVNGLPYPVGRYSSITFWQTKAWSATIFSPQTLPVYLSGFNMRSMYWPSSSFVHSNSESMVSSCSVEIVSFTSARLASGQSSATPVDVLLDSPPDFKQSRPRKVKSNSCDKRFGHKKNRRPIALQRHVSLASY